MDRSRPVEFVTRAHLCNQFIHSFVFLQTMKAFPPERLALRTFIVNSDLTKKSHVYEIELSAIADIALELGSYGRADGDLGTWAAKQVTEKHDIFGEVYFNKTD